MDAKLTSVGAVHGPWWGMALAWAMFSVITVHAEPYAQSTAGCQLLSTHDVDSSPRSSSSYALLGMCPGPYAFLVVCVLLPTSLDFLCWLRVYTPGSTETRPPPPR